MQFRFFSIPIHGGEEQSEELNRFLASQRILAVERQLVQNASASVWALCVSFEAEGAKRVAGGRRGKVDYREVLNEQDFTLYAHLRSLRKQIADTEGVPAYALFTNEQMAEMVTRRVATLSALREIPGVGEARVEKYGEAFLAAMTEVKAGTSPSDTEDALNAP